MVCFVDPLSVDVAGLKARSIPPYGLMAVWRLSSAVACDAQCDEYDDILAPGVIATSMMFQADTLLTANHPYVAFDRHTASSACTARCGRPRSITL